MPVSRRSALKAVGAVGGLTAASGTVLAVGEHEDDERTKEKDGKYADDKPDEADEPVVPEAAVRVAHFAPDAPAVDVYIDGDRVLSAFAYADVSPYLEVAPGEYTVTITAAGDPQAVVFDGDVEFGSAFYTVAAIGELGADTFRPEILVDAGSALVRVAHFSPDAPAVDILVDGEVLLENLAFEESTNYLAVPAGSYELSITPAGNPETVVASFDADVDPQTAYTAYAIGYLEPPEEFEDRSFIVLPTVDGEFGAGD
ncbi:DUF4397 domain-containing protein [Natrialba sp. INN-245]|uniref:DUF4397 domain-containing protein n=1 Tax=Natrialba sp. INN-245 TaxID=2690967 RepID=UPI001313295B|nr:DUF4397 domain-containing protein [Natrialba sp. INN-245]MWV38701.1 DUF4397 domain-containing protein [Natrialba sp. INN-245]